MPAVNPYVKLLLWPTVLLIIMAMFHDPISDFLQRLKTAEVSKDDKGFKIALAAANLAVAETNRSQPNENQKLVDLKGVAKATSHATASLSISQGRVLWVDDNPLNQQYERNALSALGIKFALARNTQEALIQIKEKKFDLIITDFWRADDPQGGYTILEKSRKLPSPLPVIIYSRSTNSEREKEAIDRGAYGETNSPQKLFELVVTALLDK